MRNKKLVKTSPASVSSIPTGTHSGRTEALAEYRKCIEYETKILGHQLGVCGFEDDTGNYSAFSEADTEFFGALVTLRREELEDLITGSGTGESRP